MAIDFFGVSISGRILQMGGGQYPDKTIELWTEQQSSIMTANLGALAFVSEIDIKYKMGENAEIALVLTPPFEDGLRFLQSDIIRYGTGRLEVELAYTTGTFSGSGAIKKEVLPFTGFLQKPDVQIGQDITITLHALGVGYQLNLVGGVEDTAFPVGTTYADAIQKTLQKYVNIGGTKGLKIDHLYDFVKDQNTPFFKTPSDKVLSGATTKPDAEVVPGVIWKGPRNDWWFVRETLSEFGYDLFIQGDQIYVVTKSFWIANNFGQSGPRKQFWLRGNVDPTRNMYPILSFQSPTEAAWLQPGLGTIVATDVDVNKKVDTGKVASASADKTPMARTKKSVNPLTTIYNIVGLDPSSILSKATDFVQAGGRLLAGDPADPAVAAQVNSHWTDLNMQSGINGQFNTIGVPDLVPGETIQVNGFDPREGTGGDPNKALFNGPYGVIEVNHKVGVGGWDTSFVAINNLNPEDFVAAAQQTLFPNAQTVASNEQPQPSDASGGASFTKTPQTQ